MNKRMPAGKLKEVTETLALFKERAVDFVTIRFYRFLYDCLVILYVLSLFQS